MIRHIAILKLRTKWFIKNILNPEKSWAIHLSAQQRYEALLNKLKISNWKYIEWYISRMDYYTFLKTPYWKAITAYKKMISNYECESCKSNQYLNVHHKTYKIRGKEYKRLDDLIVLCRACHLEEHNIQEDIRSLYVKEPLC